MGRPTSKTDLINAATANYEKMNTLISGLTKNELSTPFDLSLIHISMCIRDSISATSENHINAMDMNSDYGDGANPVILKSEFILSLCEQLIGCLLYTSRCV